MRVHVEPQQRPLQGAITVPGDKSISHRAALLAALADGTSRIHRYNPGADTRSTLACLEKLGVTHILQDDVLTVHGASTWQEPTDVLNAGNSGTTMRMLLGLLAGRDFFSVLTGDASLRERPMARVVLPLKRMGADIRGRQQGNLSPLAITGKPLLGMDYHLPVASAQVKSALLWAGLFAQGTTRVSEPHPSRDHTERLLAHAGLGIERTPSHVEIRGGRAPASFCLEVPGDPSSAAFFITAACIVPGSELLVQDVGLNPTRLGFLEVLKRMGAKIQLQVHQEEPEPVGNILVQARALTGTTIKRHEVPLLIDELPVLAVAGAMASGTLAMEGIGELRHKESDRLQGIVDLLHALGGRARVCGDNLLVTESSLKGSLLHAHGDHRMAMTAAVAALAAQGPTTICGCECVNVSHPAFFHELASLGVKVSC